MKVRRDSTFQFKCLLILSFFAWVSNSRGAPAPKPAAKESIDSLEMELEKEVEKVDDQDQGAIGSLDGLKVQAVENYKNPRSNHLSFYMAYFPLNPYYSGYAPGMTYTIFYSRNFALDIGDLSVVFANDKGLTSELADRFGVNPKVIDRLKYTAFTHGVYVFAYGKSVLMSSLIRYFRSSIFLGPGITIQSKSNRIAASYGLRLETYASDSFSLKAELRNISTITGGFENHASLSLGSTLSF